MKKKFVYVLSESGVEQIAALSKTKGCKELGKSLKCHHVTVSRIKNGAPVGLGLRKKVVSLLGEDALAMKQAGA